MNSMSQAPLITEYTTAAVNHYVLILDLLFFVHYDYWTALFLTEIYYWYLFITLMNYYIHELLHSRMMQN